jgi:uncharacterized DUF497 family protein
MIIEWDESKNEENIRKHGIDFADIPWLFFQAAIYINVSREKDGEMRIKAIANLNAIPISVIFTAREESIRIISARRASKRERRLLENIRAGEQQ